MMVLEDWRVRYFTVRESARLQTSTSGTFYVAIWSWMIFGFLWENHCLSPNTA